MTDGGFDFMKLMQQAGQMQEMVTAQQEELGRKYYEAAAGGGMVTAKVNGLLEVQSIQAEEAALKSLGLDSLLELITGAVNEALKKARESAKSDMMSQLQSLAGGVLKKDESP